LRTAATTPLSHEARTSAGAGPCEKQRRPFKG